MNSSLVSWTTELDLDAVLIVTTGFEFSWNCSWSVSSEAAASWSDCREMRSSKDGGSFWSELVASLRSTAHFCEAV